jgi:uncharacterized iron-regulated protein
MYKLPTTAHPAGRRPRWRPLCAALGLALALGACAQPGATVTDGDTPWQSLMPTALLLVGEVHDAPEHQALQARLVGDLAQQGRLGALVLEMAEQGRHTAGLAPNASEAAVRARLGWTDARGTGGWSWPTYQPVVMAAVRAGVPVLGGNLPRSQLRQVMADPRLDLALEPAALDRLRERVREGHCNLLPAHQIAPMARVQIARDKAMAATVQTALRSERTVVLVAGNEHVRKDIGVPRHLPVALPFKVLQAAPGSASVAPAGMSDVLWRSPPRPEVDHCAALREQWQSRLPKVQ